MISPARQAGPARMAVLVPVGLAGLLAGWVATGLAAAGHLLAIAGVAVAALPILAWRRPTAAVAGFLVAAVVVDQVPIGDPKGDLLGKWPLFVSLSEGVGLTGVYFNPFELLLALVLVIVLVRRLGEREARFGHRPISFAMLAVVAVVLAGAAHGLASGGDYKMVLWEIRPLVYVALAYFTAVQLPPTSATVKAMLWAFVAAVALRALDGLILAPGFLSLPKRPDFFLSHEDSFFFVLDMLLVAVLWLYRFPGGLRRFGTATLPAVILVNLVNNRRAAWVMLAFGLIAAFIFVWTRVPAARSTVAGVVVVLAVVSAIYFPVFWDRTGTLGQPARAFRSAIQPNNRDASSDLYRVIEDENLKLNITRSPVIGVGYGVPIKYAIALVDLSKVDPFIAYIPHDGILYLWLRLGLIGVVPFWAWIGLVLLASAALVRSRDDLTSVFGTLAVCSVIAYLVQGDLDMGLYWFRMAAFMGVVVGLASGLRVRQLADAVGQTSPAPPRTPIAPHARAA